MDRSRPRLRGLHQNQATICALNEEVAGLMKTEDLYIGNLQPEALRHFGSRIVNDETLLTCHPEQARPTQEGGRSKEPVLSGAEGIPK